jgi:phenylalanyl-tRNA synthetase beta chain
MEYSLYRLNKSINFKNLNLIDIVNRLNLIGFEVDNVFQEELKSNKNLIDIRLLIKIPSNRDDLLTEHFFIQEFSTIFLVDLNLKWNQIKKTYFFLLKQNYIKYNNYKSQEIKSNFSDLLIYTVECNNLRSLTTPYWVKKKLLQSNIPLINSLQDLVNLLILEWGQTINLINIPNSSLGEELKLRVECLTTQENYINNNNQIILLEKGTIVLKTFTNKIFSVLGFFDSFLTQSETKKISNLFFEGIIYDIETNPLSLNLINTNISYRFLRRTYLQNFKFAFQRLLTLLEIFNNNSLIFKKVFKKKNQVILKQKPSIRLKKQTLINILKIQLFDKNIFQKINLKLICETKNEFYFLIPTYRKDLLREIDLVEEYSRFIGYENFKEHLPMKKILYSIKSNKSRNFIKQFFTNYGFREIITPSLSDMQYQEKNSLKLTNPLNTELSILRMELLPQILNVFENNFKIVNITNNFFEIGRVFKMFNNKIIEQEKLGGIFLFPFSKQNNQSSLEWFISKGFLENFLVNFGYTNLIIEPLNEKNSVYHPTKSILIKTKNQNLGKFGMLNPLFQKNLSLKSMFYIFEFNLHHFKNWRLKSKIDNYIEYSKYPSIIKDLSFLINKKENFSVIKKLISENCNLLVSIEFFDIFYESINVTQLNVGLRLEFQSPTKTLLNEIVEEEMKKIKSLLIKNFQVEFRN